MTAFLVKLVRQQKISDSLRFGYTSLLPSHPFNDITYFLSYWTKCPSFRRINQWLRARHPVVWMRGVWQIQCCSHGDSGCWVLPRLCVGRLNGDDITQRDRRKTTSPSVPVSVFLAMTITPNVIWKQNQICLCGWTEIPRNEIWWGGTVYVCTDDVVCKKKKRFHCLWKQRHKYFCQFFFCQYLNMTLTKSAHVFDVSPRNVFLSRCRSFHLEKVT